jgi:hypothetical protein
MMLKNFENAYKESVWPFLFKTFPNLTGFQQRIDYSNLLKEMMREEISNHLKTRVVGDPRVDFHVLWSILRVIQFQRSDFDRISWTFI